MPKNESFNLTVVVTLFQGVVEEVAIFQPESEELEKYRAQWLAQAGYSDWDAYQQELAEGQPKEEYHEYSAAAPWCGFVIVNHGHPWGCAVIQANDTGFYDTFQEAREDAIFAAWEYDNDQLQVHPLGPVVFTPTGTPEELREIGLNVEDT